MVMLFGRRREDSRRDSDTFAGEALALLDALYGAAMRLARDPDQAQDLVQDTYLKAFRGRARFSPGTNLKAWLFTILHNTWRNRRRDRARARVEFDSEVVELAAERGAAAAPAGETPEALLLRADLTAEIRTALDALPEAFREVVWLRDVEDLSYQEIAEVVAIPVGTVMSRLSRGRKQLYRQLVRGRETAGVDSPAGAATRSSAHQTTGEHVTYAPSLRTGNSR
jgi:RNA polymerase sigma-70 factor (ECF subfamily)